MRQVFRLILLLCVAASAASAAPVKSVSPLDRIEVLKGRLTVNGEGRSFVITVDGLAGGDVRRFDVETAVPPARSLSFRAEAAEVWFWRGHLVVLAPREHKALTVSLAGGALELDDLQRAGYELTRFETAVSIISRNQQALQVRETPKQVTATSDWENQDIGGGGLGGCGSSCSINCGDGSTCSATCMPPRCASCTCPASCSCS